MKHRALLGAALAASLALAACGGGESTPDTTTATTAEGVDLKAAGCPDTVVIQTDWNPQAEHGHLYHLVGENYTINAKNFRVSGDLVSQGKTTGVSVEIRAGGPAIGNSVVAEMYANPDIMLGFNSTDAAISQSGGDFPTLAVIAPFNINPQIIMWDPVTYPDVKTIADLKEKNVKVRHYPDVAFMKFLTGSGILDESQIDGTYDGLAAAFLASGGKDAQQGFGTSEPYYYEKVLEAWKKPVAYQYVHDAGWTTYAQTLVGVPATVEKYDSCLKALVPVIQQSTVDYLNSPNDTNALILEAVKQYNNGWMYDAGQASAAVDQMRADKLIANSPDGTLGSFDIERVTQFIEIAAPIFSAEGSKVKEGLTAADIVTNKYIDPSISLK